MFLRGRWPFHTQPKKSAEGSAVPQRHDSQEVGPVNHPQSLRDERSINERIADREAVRLQLLETPEHVLAEAAEQADRGNRLAYPMLFDGLGADPVERCDETAEATPEVPADPGAIFGLKVLDHLREARVEFREAAKDADRLGDTVLHTELLARMDDLGDFIELVEGRWGA